MGKGGQNTMGKGFDIPCVGSFDKTGVGDQNTKSRGVKIPWVEGGSKYNG